MSFVPDVNSMLRTADNTVTGTETENSGNANTLDIGPGSGLNGFWVWCRNPAAITGTTPGYTITIRGSNDKTTWNNVPTSAGASISVVAAGEYGPYRMDTTYRYISYALARGNADNSASAIDMGLTDTIRQGPR